MCNILGWCLLSTKKMTFVLSITYCEVNTMGFSYNSIWVSCLLVLADTVDRLLIENASHHEKINTEMLTFERLVHDWVRYCFWNVDFDFCYPTCKSATFLVPFIACLTMPWADDWEPAQNKWRTGLLCYLYCPDSSTNFGLSL